MKQDVRTAVLEVVQRTFPGVEGDELVRVLAERLADEAGSTSSTGASKPELPTLERDLRERRKEISGLQAAAELFRLTDVALEDKLRRVLAIVSNAFQYPTFATVRIRYARFSFGSPNFERTPWTLVGVARGREGHGEVEVSYLQDPSGSGDPFLAEETALIRSLAEIVISGTDNALSLERGNLSQTVWDYATYEWHRADITDLPPETYYSSMAGLPPGAWYGEARTLGEFHQEDIARSTAEVASLVNGERPGDTVSFEVRTLAGQWRFSAARLLRDSEGAPVRLIGISIDTTERHLLHEQLRQSQKMEALGRLAGGVAHDFGNYLTVIATAAQLMEAYSDPGDQDHPLVMEIAKAAQSASAITGQLLSFSRARREETTDIHLGILVEHLAPVLRRAAGRDVTIELDIAGEVGLIRADPGRIEQVLLNLSVNARDAMPNGGSLTFEVCDADSSRHVLGVAQSWPHGAVILRVTDTGTGMDEETLNRLFEPFFTTKPEGKGTGLGLATVFKVIKDFGGLIFVNSSPGNGTSFKIILPRRPEPDVATADSAAHTIPS